MNEHAELFDRALAGPDPLAMRPYAPRHVVDLETDDTRQ
jgi:hypothetical protein